jgi:hypothetical protein
MSDPKSYSIDEALKAQAALRSAAGLPPEQFPLSAFVGMISDEVQVLREQGRTDDEIAGIIRKHSRIGISSGDIAANYATPEERQQHHD